MTMGNEEVVNAIEKGIRLIAVIIVTLGAFNLWTMWSRYHHLVFFHRVEEGIAQGELQASLAESLMVIALIAVALFVIRRVRNKTLQEFVDFGHKITESNIMYEAAISTMSDAMVLIENESGRILDANPAATAIYGFSREEWLTMKNTDVSAEPDATRSAGNSDKKIIPLRWHKRKSGEVFPVEISASRFEIKGTPVHLAWIKDISSRIAEEDALIEAKEKAEVGNYAKGRFIAMISHEIRTPLNGILGALQLMEAERLTENQTELLEICHDSSKLLLSTIEGILSYSEATVGAVENTNVPLTSKGLYEDIERVLRPVAEKKGLHFRGETGQRETTYFLGDRRNIQQVVLSIGNNAIKFTEQGFVKISISLQASADAAEWILRIIVSDSGIGISESQHQRIFESFTQGDDTNTKKYGGTGLGLSLANKLVSAMHGTISLESGIGKGSVFTVEIPVVGFETNPMALQPNGVDDLEQSSKAKKTVVVVDDDHASLILLEKILSGRGCHVMTFFNGSQALAWLLEHEADLIMLDLNLPDITGQDMAKRIRDMAYSPNVNVPILAMTAYTQSEVADSCMKAGMNDVLTKPIMVNQLNLKIEQLMKA